MENFSLTQQFPGIVSHAIHSLSLQDLRHYFEPNADELNGIPNVNLDLEADEEVLMNAPNTNYEEGFITMGLRAVDQALSHMDNPHYDMGIYTTLERLVHTLHMQETWEMIKPIYEGLKANPPKDKNVCSCVKDIQNNGVLEFLHFIASKIRHPDAGYLLFKAFQDPEVKQEGNEHIKNEAVWKIWKKMMLEVHSEDHYEAAVFLYCMLNE